ncbi:SH3 domain protein [Necator americanus]|nr:SH3 domain protein [Necator americanus]ETN83777.1 SH3 domain protein [Necator americanus]
MLERVDATKFNSTPQTMYLVNNAGDREGHLVDHSTPQRTAQSDKEILVALYAYDSRADGDLSFKKGDIMYLLDQSNCDWWYVRHQRTGNTGYVPRNFVAKQQTIESEE